MIPTITTMKLSSSLLRMKTVAGYYKSRYHCSNTIIRRKFSSNNTLLHTKEIKVDNNSKNNDVVFLHGLLGNGKNLTTMAKRMGGGILVDLRGHGKSMSSFGQQRHTFENCAKDVIQSVDTTISTVVGHSFGGRVALECAMQLSSKNATTWLLDTVPGQADGSVVEVFETIQSIDIQNYDTKSDISKVLTEEKNMNVGLAQWLTSSMTSDDSSLKWGFDLDIIEDLLPEFGTQDFMGKLQHLVLSEEEQQNSSVIHLVRGGKNTSWSMDILSKLQEIQDKSNNRFYLHVLPNAGHWVHVEDLPGLVKLWETYKTK